MLYLTLMYLKKLSAKLIGPPVASRNASLEFNYEGQRESNKSNKK